MTTHEIDTVAVTRHSRQTGLTTVITCSCGERVASRQPLTATTRYSEHLRETALAAR